MSAAVYLAHDIEWMRAIERAGAKWPTRRGARRGERWKQAIAREFDPHAATELADLIEHRMRLAALKDPNP